MLKSHIDSDPNIWILGDVSSLTYMTDMRSFLFVKKKKIDCISAPFLDILLY